MKAIMYHYVRPFNKAMPHLKHLHLEDFNKQLDYFEETYGFVSKNDFFNSFKSGIVPQGVVLTFDDGLKCHYDFVFKELKKRNLWGIFYIPTGMYITKKVIDVHRIHILLATQDSKKIYEKLSELINDDILIDSGKIEFTEQTYKIQDNDDYTVLVKRILNYYISYQYREKIIDDLVENFKLQNFDDYKKFYINSEEIKEMNDNGMIIGSHTVNHPVLSKLSEKEQEIEIHQSFDYLHSMCENLAIKTFCYPYGGFHSFNDLTEKILSEYNCLFSFNVENRDIMLNDIINRCQALPRYDCNQFKFGKIR